MFNRPARLILLIAEISLWFVPAQVVKGAQEQETAHWKVVTQNESVTITLREGLEASGYLYCPSGQYCGGILTDETTKNTQNFVYRWEGKEFKRKFPVTGAEEKINVVEKIAKYLPELKGKVTDDQWRFLEFLVRHYGQR